MAEAPDRGELTQAQTIAALQAALEAERVRSREIDHRAKNSLQLVASLLLLQSKRSKEPETQRTLKAMHQRLGAVAAVHRDILTAERPEAFDFTQFVREHLTALTESHEGAAVRLALDPVEVRAAHACPLALIVNELAMNALTHGAGGPSGTAVSLDLKSADGGFRLTVQDDGAGRPPEPAESGFGLTMVKLLAQQVGASFTLEPAQPGVRAVVTAP
ncbi:sensor histidine kinase [Phenylobacterium sp. LjRoot219]|uniref:sensor histidine kinase n=1 Tax=Phenylobacterium sp. LjRoot219 TaxID=3342283 RepID=UPI003ECDD7A8